MSNCPDITLEGLQISLLETEEPVQNSTISSALHSPGLYERVARRKPLLRKVNIKALLGIARRHVTNSVSFWKKDCEPFGLKAKWYVW